MAERERDIRQAATAWLEREHPDYGNIVKSAMVEAALWGAAAERERIEQLEAAIRAVLQRDCQSDFHGSCVDCDGLLSVVLVAPPRPEPARREGAGDGY